MNANKNANITKKKAELCFTLSSVRIAKPATADRAKMAADLLTFRQQKNRSNLSSLHDLRDPQPTKENKEPVKCIFKSAFYKPTIREH